MHFSLEVLLSISRTDYFLIYLFALLIFLHEAKKLKISFSFKLESPFLNKSLLNNAFRFEKIDFKNDIFVVLLST